MKTMRREDEPTGREEHVMRDEAGGGQASEYRVDPGVLEGMQTQRRDEPTRRDEPSRRQHIRRESRNRSEYRLPPGHLDGMETRRT
jgi:hypothetical protein